MFINTIQKNLNKNKKDEQINYKIVQKKTRKTTKTQNTSKQVTKIKT
jgi:hypothetical protein